MRIGVCHSIPQILDNGKIELYEKWQWLNGDKSEGESVVGEGSELLLLTDGDKLISFCTFAKKDEIILTEYSPWKAFMEAHQEYM